MKACSNNRCTEINPQNLDNFHRDKSKKDGFRTRCKSCIAPLKAKWNKENPERKAARNKEWQKKNPERWRNGILQYKFNISLEQYNQMLIVQNESCAICLVHKSKLKKQLEVDHCHVTSEIRGLLCGTCNRALGLLKDNVAIIDRASKYLGEHCAKKKISFNQNERTEEENANEPGKIVD